MRVFITGASGFVGSHASERLVAAGHEVLAMARSDRSAAAVARFGAAPVRCSLDDVAAEHLEGVDAVVHCAAFVEEYGTREQFRAVNVEGTQRLLDAARAAGVRRFVHIGTEAALFDGADLLDVDETRPYPERQRFLYSESKAEAERRVLAASGGGLETVSLRPRLVWGPRDNSVLPAVLRMIEDGGWAWLDGGAHRTSTCHVSNLAAAIELALTRGRGGQAYFVADDGERSMKDFLSALTGTRGVTPPERSVPGWLVRPVSAAVEGTWRLLGLEKTPPMTRFAVAMMSASITVRTDKAREELGYRPEISVDQGMAALRA
jgi:nucleoside-diphosphate-sugar epimerase